MIGERDLFYFIWYPEILDSEIYSYIKSNNEDYKWVLQTLKLIYDLEKVKPDDKIMKKIIELANKIFIKIFI